MTLWTDKEVVYPNLFPDTVVNQVQLSCVAQSSLATRDICFADLPPRVGHHTESSFCGWSLQLADLS